MKADSGRWLRWVALVAGLAVVAVIPLLPATNNYRLFTLALIGLYTMLTVGLSLVMGYAGQISLGHATFFGMGAYGSAILSVHFNLPPMLTVPVAALITALCAYVVGIRIFQLRGHYLAMATMGLNVIFVLLALNQELLTGGPTGFVGIPPLAVGGFVFNSDRRMYYVIWGVTLLVLLLSLNVVNSRVGRALRAIHASEAAAEAVGVDVTAFKLRVFTLAAAYAGLAGGLYAHYLGFISPSSFSILFSIELVAMVAVGGLASIWGSIFGAATIQLMSEFIRDNMSKLLGGSSGEQEIIAFGLILMLIMIFLPDGLTSGGLKALRNWQARRKAGAGNQHVPT
ncbi:MAG: branched-chain amino acid ABC transporter permease [Chloroflexi bacterium]|nr:branched-chain amino acid ABC transporter permease [Chloroflexota bacterium]